MGNPKGFIEIKRKVGGYRPVKDRVGDFKEVERTLNLAERQDQAARCMDCGIPFCHWSCPISNNIPEWQDAMYKGDWEEAIKNLQSTNNFPEITGRVCPAPCEAGCVLNRDGEPVTIRENEHDIVENAFKTGLIKASPPKVRSGKKVAVIGSGPAGLSCADLLNKWGHTVTVFEQDDEVGGLMRYGIPDFKLEKSVIERRVKLFVEEGMIIKTNVKVGVDIKNDQLLKEFDAVCLAIGAMKPRDLPIEGRETKGVHFAMEFLRQQNKVVRGDQFSETDRILATGKNVLVIGGGDTGSDCVGTSIRQGAKSVTQIEILPKPPEVRSRGNGSPWPYWPNTLRTSSSHLEGCERKWSLASKKVVVEKGQVKGVEVVEVEWTNVKGKWEMKELPETKKVLKAELVLLSMGFVHPIHEDVADDMKVEYDSRGNVAVKDFVTSKAKVFAAGDAVTGASLIVRAIDSGRKSAAKIHDYLATLK